MKKYAIVLMLAFLSFSISASAQIKVTGQVFSSEDNRPLAGVAVLEKGTYNGTLTDGNGKFTLSVKDKNARMVFSFMGYLDMELPYEANLTVKLKEQAIVLDEVVAIGYGTVKKSDLTGSLASITAQDIEGARATSVDQVLAGRAAGVFATTTSGEPGAGLSIRIRGASSINADVEPLYVIDGIPIEKSGIASSAFSGMGISASDPLGSINPNDIQSIEVLKDASATAIYGSRGANGVILITTKSGEAGKTKINYSGSIGINFKPQKKIEMMSGNEFSEFMSMIEPTNLKYTNEDGTPVIYPESETMDWQDELIRPSFYHNHSLSVSGGSKANVYSASLGYLKNDGIIKSDYDRINFNVKFRSNLTKRLTFNASLITSISEQNGSISGTTGSGASASLIKQMLVFRPVNFWEEDDDDLQTTGTNPLNYVDSYVKNNKRYETYYNFALQYKILDGLSFRTMLGGNYNILRTKEFFPDGIGSGYGVNGQNTSAYVMQNKWISENTLTYNKVLKKKHSINAVLGFIIESQDRRREVIQVQNISDQSLGAESIIFGQNIKPVQNENTLNTGMSYLARLNYTYDSRYLFTASVRADGSSKFTENNKFSIFPSMAFAWRLSREKFMQNAKAISDFKIRCSFGYSGNQGISAYSTFNKMTPVWYPTDGTNLTPGIVPQSLGNNLLRWETTRQIDFGFDLSLFSNRLAFNFDVYDKTSVDLLLNQEISYVTGVTTMMSNVGSVRNRGYEFTVNSVNVSTRNFSWDTSINFSTNFNKVLDLGSVDRFYVDPGNGNIVTNAFIVKEGEAIGTMWGYKFDGIYQYSDFVEFYNVDPATGSMTLKSLEECAQIYNSDRTNLTLLPGIPSRSGVTVEPGFAKYRDLDGDGVITDSDRTSIGESEPYLYGGITNNFTYKNLSLSVFLRYSLGNKLYNAGITSMTLSTVNQNKTKALWNNAWRPTAPANGYPCTYDVDGNQRLSSDLFVEDASYLKISDVTLSYSLPSKWLKAVDIDNVTFSVSAKNIWTFTKYSMFDPDIVSNNALSRGWDMFNYPQNRSIIFSVNVSF